VLFAFGAANLAAQLPQASPIATGTLVVRGRCVDSDSGAPLQRCRVALTGHQSTGYAMAWSRSDWADPPEQTTGPDGTFRFEVRLPAADEELDRGRYHLQISHPQYAAWFSHCAFVIAVARGGADYGDVRLPKGVRFRLRCEDTNKAPQPGVLLDFRRSKGNGSADGLAFTEGDGPHWWIESNAYARTDIDGCLHLDDPLLPGDYTLAVRNRELRSAPAAIKLPCSEPIVAVVAPLDSVPSILGKLVDESGLPVEGALLSDGGDGGNQCVTRRDGAFTLVAGKPTKGSTAMLSMAQNGRFDGWIVVGQAEWGAREVELAVPAKTQHTFIVRTAQGAAVEDFNLYCMRSVQGAASGVRLAGSFTGGRAPCLLPAGDYQLLVVPRSERMLGSGWQAIKIDPAQQEIAVSVPDAVARTVEIRFADDHTPAVGVLVEAIEGGEPAPFAWVPPNTVIDMHRRAPAAQVVASARTSAGGSATLQLGGIADLHLRISGPRVCTVVQTTDLTDGKAVPVIAVERGATLLGSLGPVAALRALDPDRRADQRPSIYSYHSWFAPTLTVVFGADHQRWEGIRLDQEGRFRCDGLPPGPVELQLRYRQKDGNRRPLVEPPLVLGSWTLRTDAPQSVELQLPAGVGSSR
jgi:hypothetical protein